MNGPTERASHESVLARIFEGQAPEETSWFTLSGGAPLFSAGEAADTLFLLKAGRLGVYRAGTDGQPVLAGLVRPGEPVGEMAMIAGTNHTATVVALRDSEIVALPRDAFLRTIPAHPDLLMDLARTVVLRTRDAAPLSEPRVFAFLGLTEAPVRDLTEAVARTVRNMGFSVRVVTSEAVRSADSWFASLEDSHDYVFYCAGSEDSGWRNLCIRQVDHLFWVADSQEEICNPLVRSEDPLAHLREPDLVLLHPPRTPPHGTGRWLDAVRPGRWFHLCQSLKASDLERLARLVTGQSVGLVLSGGGARAFAHIGAIRALREARIPIDFVGGASMGGIIAATLAMGWDQAECDKRMRAAFVDSSPLDDIAFPLLAMTNGNKVDARLETHFGDVAIEDLGLPFFCVSSNLTTGTHLCHRRGRLREALRASISLPGVMPPVVMNGQVLVDGAVMRSFPADLMRDMHLGTVIGVDVTRARGLDPQSLALNKSLGDWVLSGDWRKGPPIVSVLMRSATITTASDLAESRRATDFLVIPQPAGVEIRDWKAYDLAVAAGHAATRTMLSKLDCPLPLLRIRRQTVHPDVPLITFDRDEQRLATRLGDPSPSAALGDNKQARKRK
ncbi:MAG: patatin-like phospholipase family protein [Asticcacaulis sp.]